MTSQIMIIAIALILGFACGVIMHRSDFCLAGVFRDLFLFRSSPLLSSLMLLIALSMMLFEIARITGFLSYTLPSSLYGLPALTTLAGGILFGVGMVLAGGCVVGVLYKLGAGSLLALVALIGMMFGSVLYAEFHPFWAQLTRSTRLSQAATLPQLLEINQTFALALVAATLLLLVLFRQRQGKLYRPSVVKGYLQPGHAAILLAVIGLLSFVLLGMPLGITTTYAKAGAFFEQLIFPVHVAAGDYFHSRGFSYYSPLSQQTLTAGAGPFLDGLSLVQFPLIGGLLLGSCCSSVVMKTFSLRWRIPWEQWVSVAAGGILMGLASRMGPACNVWHLLGGIPLLSLQSLLFVVGLVPGAWIGTQLLTRHVVRC